MVHLVTTDNNLGKNLTSLNCSSEDIEEVSKDLFGIANVSLNELNDKNSALIVFPKQLCDFNDGIGEQKIIEIIGDYTKPIDAKIKTGNLMGFIGVGNVQLTIQSRFSEKIYDGAGEEDFFLHYMLEKVGLVNLFDLKHSAKKDRYFDFLLYLFPSFLKKALSQGLFKSYCTFKRNDGNIRGIIDIPRHIKENTPFIGQIAYNKHERTFDNEITQLIRHTIEFIKVKPYGKKILNSNHKIKQDISEIVQATQSYNIRERESIISKNLKQINHPYFTAYKPLQKLCLAILQHEKIAYRNNNKKIYGILFDGAWLWEEYLATILKKANFNHPKNKENVGGIRMFQNEKDELSFGKNYRKIYPDFYKKDGNELNSMILDAKYKKLQNGVGREDLYQIVTYMHTMKIMRGGFIYPIEDNISTELLVNKYKLSEKGFGGEIKLLGITIPRTEGKSLQEKYNNFHERMKSIESCLLHEIEQENISTDS